MKLQKISALFTDLTNQTVALGAHRATVLPAKKIMTNRQFRDMCAVNACGMYGKCYMCPPDIGQIEELMAELRQYDHVLVYQYIGRLEDSFDVEGMADAKEAQRRIAHGLRPLFDGLGLPRTLHLSTGGCGLCRPCEKVHGKPCAHPGEALSSLEAYGIHVSHLAERAGMKYINGQNTVTYFGAVLFSLS